MSQRKCSRIPRAASSRCQRQAIGPTESAMIAIAPKKYPSFASRRMCSRLADVDLPEDVGDTEAGDDQPADRRARGHPARGRCGSRRGEPPRARAAQRRDRVLDVLAASAPGRAAATAPRRRPAPRPAAAAARDSARDRRSAGGRGGSGCSCRSARRPGRAGTRRGSRPPARRRCGRRRGGARGCRAGRARAARCRRGRPRPRRKRRTWRRRISRCRSSLSSWQSAIDGEHVGEVRLVAGNGDVVERAVAAAHDPMLVDRARDGVVVRRDHAALAGSDVLRRVEREAGGRREAADLAAAVGALDRVGGVLDHGQAEREERVEVGGLAGKVDGQDRLRPSARRARATSSGSMFRSLSRTSAKTGVAPVWTITFAVAGHVIGVVITSSPGPTPSATSARCSAAVPDVTASACFASTYSAKRRSSSAARGPVVSQPERSVSVTASISSSPTAGGWNERNVSRRVEESSCTGEAYCPYGRDRQCQAHAWHCQTPG